MAKVKVSVRLKPGVLDAQGRVVFNALKSLGYEAVADVRMGKLIEIEMNGTSPDDARAQADDMCRKLLANPVIENYTIEVTEE
jgi:phosphoribosylformylglycinamidine synthase PurS subunit